MKWLALVYLVYVHVYPYTHNLCLFCANVCFCLPEESPLQKVMGHTKDDGIQEMDHHDDRVVPDDTPTDPRADSPGEGQEEMEVEEEEDDVFTLNLGRPAEPDECLSDDEVCNSCTIYYQSVCCTGDILC